MRLRLIRHATLLVEMAGRRLLVDPMLNPAGAVPPVPGTPAPRPNPLVPLPAPVAEILAGVDAVLVTHSHNDHFDAGAAAALPRNLPLLCQPADAAAFAGLGFADVRPVADEADLGSLRIARAGGRHGTGEIGARMGPVSGFVLRAEGERALYVAGDTVWCPEVAEALERHRPGAVVVNAGAARFLEGDPITSITTAARMPDTSAGTFCRSAGPVNDGERPSGEQP